MRRAIITVGLGFGDEGKGAAVDYLCRQYGADLVVRYCGGSQAGHNVELPDGRRHTFSQFGAGTLAGVPTYLGEAVILNPTVLAREAEHLRELSVAEPFGTLSVHPGCLVTTYFHQAANRLRELARGANRHGSCGHGIGETRRYWLRYGHDAVRACDLVEPAVLREKLELLRQRLLLDLQECVADVPTDALTEYDLLGLTTTAVAEPLLALGSLLRLQVEPPAGETAIFEGAQGVLLDEWYGFHPYTTWSTVTPYHALEMAMANDAREVCVLGLTRAYATRHGAGPFPTSDDALTARLNDVGNPWNEWQGSIRAGWLDLVLLRYAIRACGGIDNLAVSCLDHVADEARVCCAYEGCPDLPLPPRPSLGHQEKLTGILSGAVPVCWPVTAARLRELLNEIAPVAMTATGPTHRDRECTELRFRRRK